MSRHALSPAASFIVEGIRWYEAGWTRTSR